MQHVWGRGIWRVLVEKPKGKGPLARPKNKWGILRCNFRKWDVGHGLD